MKERKKAEGEKWKETVALVKRRERDRLIFALTSYVLESPVPSRFTFGDIFVSSVVSTGLPRCPKCVYPDFALSIQSLLDLRAAISAADESKVWSHSFSLFCVGNSSRDRSWSDFVISEWNSKVILRFGAIEEILCKFVQSVQILRDWKKRKHVPETVT